MDHIIGKRSFFKKAGFYVFCFHDFGTHHLNYSPPEQSHASYRYSYKLEVRKFYFLTNDGHQ